MVSGRVDFPSPSALILLCSYSDQSVNLCILEFALPDKHKSTIATHWSQITITSNLTSIGCYSWYVSLNLGQSHTLWENILSLRQLSVTDKRVLVNCLKEPAQELTHYNTQQHNCWKCPNNHVKLILVEFFNKKMTVSQSSVWIFPIFYLYDF